MLRKTLALISLPLGVILAFYLTRWLLSYAVQGFMVSFGGGWLANDEILFNLIISIISYCIILAILSLLPIKTLFGKETAGPVDDSRKHDIILHIILAVAGFIAYYLISLLLANLFSNFPWYNAGQEQEVVYSSASNLTQIILSGVALILVAPYFEESIFRGWLYANLRKLRVNGILAALAVSLAFAFLHGQLNVGLDTFALSLIACYLYEQTGSIRPAVLLHMIKNSIAFYFLFFAG